MLLNVIQKFGLVFRWRVWAGLGAVMTALVALFWGSIYISLIDLRIALISREIKLQDRSPNRSLAYTQRARLYSKRAYFGKSSGFGMAEDQYQNLVNRAFSDHEEAIRLGPRISENYSSKGTTYLSHGKLLRKTRPKDSTQMLLEASQAFEQALELQPPNEQLRDAFSEALILLAKFDQANLAFPDEPAFAIKKALILCKKGYHFQYIDWKSALDAFSKSIEINSRPDSLDCDPYSGIIETYLQKNQIELAQKYKKQAIAHRSYIRPQLKKRLDSLEKTTQN